MDNLAINYLDWHTLKTQMRTKFNFNNNKALSAISYVLDSLGKKTDFHKLFKILYFADREHLAKYGRPIIGDAYIAMKNGPVPSWIYDNFKYIRNGYNSKDDFFKDFVNYFTLEEKTFAILKNNYSIDHLSETDIECLSKSVSENKDIDFYKLTEKSHQEAWNKADLNDEMSIIDIALEGGAPQEMITHILENIENQYIFNHFKC